MDDAGDLELWQFIQQKYFDWASKDWKYRNVWQIRLGDLNSDIHLIDPKLGGIENLGREVLDIYWEE